MRKLIKFLRLIRANIALVAVVFLALILRLFYISDLPPSLNWDEVSHGYNAYSILKTGKDEWGITLPTIFRAYGDYKLPVYIYLTAVSEAVLGLNELAVRLPSILAGTISVVFTFLFVRHLTKKRLLALISALLLAVEPWGLFLSRIASEANVSVALIISGAYFFLRGKDSPKFLPLSAVLLGLSVWTYNSARVFVPLLLAVLVLVYKKELITIWKKKTKLAAGTLILLAFFFLPMFWQLVNPSGQARYGWVEILDEGAIAQINESRVSSNLAGILPTLAHNKATFFLKTFISNYFSHFSPEFLFFEGGSNYQFSVPGYGLLYLINLPFFLLGLTILIFGLRKSRALRLVIAWFLLAPVASSLTREAPHVLRSIVFLPTLQIISAIGVTHAFSWTRKNYKRVSVYLAGAYFLILLLQVENYTQNAVLDYRNKFSWSWQYGYKQIVHYAKEHYGEYDKIIVTKKYGEPHEFFLFYGAAASSASWADPQAYQNDPNLIRFYQSNWYWVDAFDKFYFVNDWDIPETGVDFVLESGGEVSCLDRDCLLITSPGNYPTEWSKLKTINFLDGQPAFEIYEN